MGFASSRQLRIPAEEPWPIREVRRHARQPLRPKRELLGRAPDPATCADPALADLERARLHRVLVTAAVRARLRPLAESRSPGSEEGRSRREDHRGRTAELLLGLPRADVQARREALFRR